MKTAGASVLNRFIISTIAASSLLVTFLPVTAQAPGAGQPTAQPPQGQGGAPEGQPANTSGNMTPIAAKDLRFHLANLSVDKRIDPNGQGEILDVSFDLFNQSSDAIHLFGYFVAFYEEDAVNEKNRQFVPYPEWRTHDPAATTFLVQTMHVVPREVKPSEVWKPEDSMYKQFHYTADRLRKDLRPGFPDTEVLPPAWMVVDFLAGRPTEGLSFTLPGTEGPGPDAAARYLTDYSEETPEEKKAGKKPQFHTHSYTLEFAQRRAIVRTHHFSKYRTDFKLYNRYAVVFFDADAVKSHQEDTSETKKPISPVFYRTYTIDKPIKFY